MGENDRRLPINQEKARLEALGYSAKIFKHKPRSKRKTSLPHLNLSILKPPFPPALNITDQAIINWLKSNEVLPLLDN